MSGCGCNRVPAVQHSAEGELPLHVGESSQVRADPVPSSTGSLREVVTNGDTDDLFERRLGRDLGPWRRGVRLVEVVPPPGVGPLPGTSDGGASSLGQECSGAVVAGVQLRVKRIDDLRTEGDRFDEEVPESARDAVPLHPFGRPAVYECRFDEDVSGD